MEDFDETIERSFGVKRRDVQPPTADDDFTQTTEIIGDDPRPMPARDLPIIDVTVGPETVQPAQHAAPSSMRKWLIGGGIATVAVVGGAIVWRRRTRGGEVGSDSTPSSPSEDPSAQSDAPKPTPEPASEGGEWWTRVPSLPTADEVPGFDLTKNWGKTPVKMRPLLALMERVSKIEGSARIFAVIAKRESDFVPTAQRTTEVETNGSRRAYKNNRDRNQPLKYGEASGEFGSGGLFAALGPYFLWTGVQEMKGRAPLLNAPPEVMFVPRIAAFGAVVYLQRLLKNYQIDDHADLKAGWANPQLLKKLRGGATHKMVRTKFFADASKLGIDLEDTSTIPKDLSSKSWPGVETAFTSLTGITAEETAEG